VASSNCLSELPSVLEDEFEVRTIFGHVKYENIRKLTSILASRECTQLDTRAAANCILYLASRLDMYRQASLIPNQPTKENPDGTPS
jgi:hypothetical protein